VPGKNPSHGKQCRVHAASTHDRQSHRGAIHGAPGRFTCKRGKTSGTQVQHALSIGTSATGFRHFFDG
jgi:hypothetical protein